MAETHTADQSSQSDGVAPASPPPDTTPPDFTPDSPAEAAATPDPTGRRWLTWRKVILLVIGGICLLGVAGAVGGYWLLQATPVYWQQRQQYLTSLSLQDLKREAESLERRILNELSYVSSGSPLEGEGTQQNAQGAGQDSDVAIPHEPRTVSLTINEVNAWMAKRLKSWMKNQQMHIPKGVTDPMVAVQDEHLVLAFQFDSGELSSVISLLFTVEIQDNHEAQIKLNKMRGGRLPLPTGIVHRLGTAGTSAKHQQQIASLAEAFDGMTFDPVMRFDQQQIRVLAIGLHPDRIDLTIQAEEVKKPPK